MYNYLETKTADYTGEILDVSPQKIIKIPGKKTQTIHDIDDNSITVISESDNSYFSVDLQWTSITNIEYETIMDLWHNINKANGMENTFKWRNIIDDYIYVVRFMSDLSTIHYSYPYPSINNLLLSVEGLSA